MMIGGIGLLSGVTTATTQPRFYFGNDARELCSYANGADRSITFLWRNTALQ